MASKRKRPSVQERPECVYCNDTGKAPDSDDRTPCGFCGEA